MCGRAMKMDGLVQDFLSQFHNLSGSTLSERKKSAFQLFHSHSHLKTNPEVLGGICAQLNAENHLERVFMIDFFLHFRCFLELREEFLKGNDIIVSKISKESWFFRQAAQEFGVDFVEKILPKVSFSLRLKIVKRICPHFDEEQNDHIFDSLLERYGVTVATHMITNCSVGKIEEMLQKYPLRLWQSHLELLHAKNRNLIVSYMREREKLEGNNEFMRNEPFAGYLARNDPDLYCELSEKYVLKHRIGRRTTKKLVALKKNEILAKPKVYLNQFRLDKFVRKMGLDFKHFYLKIFPRKLSEVHFGDTRQYLKYYAKNGRFHLFADTFKQVFQRDLDEFPSIMNEHLFTLIPSDQEKEKWSSLLVKDDAIDEASWKYLKPDECFSKITQTFNTSREASDRSEKLSVITKSCILYDDYRILNDLFAMILTRFKNDYIYSKMRPLQEIVLYGSFEKFTQKHWDDVNKILDSEQAAFNSQYFEVKLEYFRYLFKENKSLKSALKNYKTTNYTPSHFIIDHYYKNKTEIGRFKKSLLLALLEVPVKKPDQSLASYDANLVLAICTFNGNCGKNNRINIFDHPRLIESLSKLFKDNDKDECLFDQLALNLHLILKENSDQSNEDFHKVIIENFDGIASLPLARWFLFNRPQLVSANLEKFLEICIEKYRDWNWNPGHGGLNRKEIWFIIKAHSFLEIDKKALHYCLERLKDSQYEKKYLLSTPLSVLMAPEDYLKLVESYTPLADCRGDSESDKKLFELQTNLIFSAKSLNLQISALPTVLNYLKGDYLRYGLSPLLKLSYSVPEFQVNLIVNELEKIGPISARKHALFITALLDETSKLRALKSSNLTQSLTTTLKYFLLNPCEEIWEMVVLKLPKLDKNDNFSSKLVTEACVHSLYKARYFMKAWEVLDATDNKFKHVLINRIHKQTINELPMEFCSKIIQKDLFKIPKIYEFVGTYLIMGQDPAKFQVISNVLSRFKNEHWDKKDSESREKLALLIEKIFKMYMESPIDDLAFVNGLISNFERIFSHVEAFEDFVLLTLMKYKCQNDKDLSRSIIVLNKNLIATYDALVIDIVADCIKKHLKTFTASNLDFLMDLLKARESKYDVILVIKLLPKDQLEVVGENSEIYPKILEIIAQCDDTSVRLQFQLYLKEIGSNPMLNFAPINQGQRLLLGSKVLGRQ